MSGICDQTSFLLTNYSIISIFPGKTSLSWQCFSITKSNFLLDSHRYFRSDKMKMRGPRQKSRREVVRNKHKCTLFHSGHLRRPNLENLIAGVAPSDFGVIAISNFIANSHMVAGRGQICHSQFRSPQYISSICFWTEDFSLGFVHSSTKYVSPVE